MAKTKKNVRTKKATAAYVAKMATIRKNREQWIKALESGRYKQTTGQLRNIDNGYTLNGNSYGYCCLGVLCNIHKDKEHKWDDHVFTAPNLFYDSNDVFDSATDEYFEMPPNSFLDKVKVDKGLADELATMNDNGKTFKEIATFLRKKWRMPKA
jgi:hypothetical protein